ncbi:MAG: peptidase S41 [Thermoanaerobaculia bacterium]|nr:MAG: peptidase S41 [Thermoanaerobaculia bacterium]
MFRSLAPVLVLALALGTSPATAAEGPTQLLRFPDVHGEQVVFTYGGDLWRASATGGTAVRLTAHPGLELFGRFSPDGRWIAFTGQYDGDEQVYVVPAEGGEPRQLTFYPAHGPLSPRWGYDNQVYGWTPDGLRILFRAGRDADGGRTESALYAVPFEGGLAEKLPMPTAGAGDYSPDARRLVYSPLFRDFRTWKRYQGGWAQDLYLFDLASHALTPIAPSLRTERDPMWIGDAIYFVSDRDGTLNLYRSDLGGTQVEQLTFSKSWDVRWASSDNRGRIVYESGGALELFDIASGATTRLAIHVPDDGLNRRPARISAAKQIEDFELAPKGERALFVARGDVFTAPIEKGPTRNLTHSSRAHDRHARWSPDGKRIAFVSDLSGEDQVYLVAQDGKSAPEALTSGLAAMLYAPAWAPDGARIAFSDKDGKVYVVSVADKKRLEIADDEYGRVLDYSWSPDGAWLAFSLAEENGNNALWIWSAADGQKRKVTATPFSEYFPAWDPQGDYLFFLSEREFAPQFSQIEWNYAGNRMTGVFAYALRKDVAHPFPPESDEVGAGEDEKKDGEKAAEESGKDGDRKGKKESAGDDAKKEAKKPVRIDFEGLGARVAAVPVAADNISALAATKGLLFYTSEAMAYYGREAERKPKLRVFDFKKREATDFADDVQGWAISPDGSMVLVRQNGAFKRFEAKPKASDPKTVSTAGLEVDRVPAEEWAEIFDEVWRRYRDFFYVRNLHGYDWKAIGERYRTLLPYVAHRSDLNYVIGEMIAELNVGHAYVEGGDFEIPARPKVGLPGARFALDPGSGRYRIAKIFAGHNHESRYRSPLTEVGVDAREGDFVLAIDGVELKAPDNPYRLLRHKTDPVTLTLNSTPTEAGARQVTYRPIDDESSLLYLDWVDGNRRWVAEKSGGRVGYLHIPDMGAPGAYEWVKWFYPQIRKEGMVVDVRSNGGGNISQWIIERLDSRLLGTRFGYSSDHPQTYPYTVFHGHLVCLLNQTSASDGDIFPARFKKSGLGPLIGKRSWGGVVGISGTGPLIDGGTIYVPQQATNDVDGSYIIEGHGVDPDIEVDNDPAAVIAGRDPQLERGLEEVMKAMEREPRKLPTRPADPVKTP